jgi:hypothetical protein
VRVERERSVALCGEEAAAGGVVGGAAVSCGECAAGVDLGSPPVVGQPLWGVFAGLVDQNCVRRCGWNRRYIVSSLRVATTLLGARPISGRPQGCDAGHLKLWGVDLAVRACLGTDPSSVVAASGLALAASFCVRVPVSVSVSVRVDPKGPMYCCVGLVCTDAKPEVMVNTGNRNWNRVGVIAPRGSDPAPSAVTSDNADHWDHR